MPWTAPFTAVPGQLMTAALWNSQIRDNLGVLKTSIADDGRVSGELLTYRETLAAFNAAAVTTLDLATANNFTITLVANIGTLSVINWPTTPLKVTTVTIRFVQDATGGRTIAWPAGWRWDSGAAPAMPTAAGASMIVVLWTDQPNATTVFAAVFIGNG